MAYEAATIATALTGGAGYTSMIRTMRGQIYVVHYDSTASPARCLGYYSDGSGRPGTWNAEAWSDEIGGPPFDTGPYTAAGGGGDNPILLGDPLGEIWMVMSRYGGIDSPHVIRRREHDQTWAWPDLYGSGFARLTTTSAVTSLSACMDPHFKLLGIWNVAAVFVKSGALYYVDMMTGVTDQLVDAVNFDYTSCKIVARRDGIKYIVATDTSNDMWSFATGGWGTTVQFSSRVQVNGGGQSVTSLEDVCLGIAGFPEVIYRVLVGGINRLHWAEYLNFAAGWGNQRVWDGTNDYGFFPGQSLAFDVRGSLFVIGPYDHDGDAVATDGELYEWDLIRALEPPPASWLKIPRTAGVGGTILATDTLNRRTPAQVGFMPNIMNQGFVFLSYIWPAGAAVSEQYLTFASRDTISEAATIYPSLFSELSGNPPFRAGETDQRTPITLPGEGASVGNLPSIAPSFEVVRGKTYRMAGRTFEAGYEARVCRGTSGRGIYTVAFRGLTDDDKVTLTTYLYARQKEGETFTWSYTTEDGETVTVDVKVWPESIEPDKIIMDDGVGRWAFVVRFVDVVNP